MPFNPYEPESDEEARDNVRDFSVAEVNRNAHEYAASVCQCVVKPIGTFTAEDGRVGVLWDGKSVDSSKCEVHR